MQNYIIHFLFISADFGFARSVGAGSTNVSTPCGSFSYAAPELLSAKPGSVYDGKKVDIWSM